MERAYTRTRLSGELTEPLLEQHDLIAAADSAEPAASPTTAHLPTCTAGHGRWSACWFAWVTPLMRTGCSRQLQPNDLLRLDPSLQPELCGRRLWLNWSKELLIRPERPSLLRTLIRTYGKPYAWLGLLKLLNDLLSFLGPLLLKLLVTWLMAVAPTAPPPPATAITPQPHESIWPGSNLNVQIDGTSGGAAATNNRWEWWRALTATLGPSSQHFGLMCVALLGLTSVARALLNAHFNYQLSRLSCQLRAGLMCVLYRKSLLAVRYDHGTKAGPSGTRPAGAAAGGAAHGGGAGPTAEPSVPANAKEEEEVQQKDAKHGTQGGVDVNTLMSVDSDRAVNLLLSFHELWSLPMQMVLALYLLYTQVRYAFLAGLVVSLLLVPANRLIANRILTASKDMMAAKDARVGTMSELLRSITAVKTAPLWEQFFVTKISTARRRELRGLAVRKYLDALCVYFWAATSLLFSALTFGLLVLLEGPSALTPGIAFTALSLFQLLTGPLNAFPWVLNGVVEAIVSVRRLQGYLFRPETKALWAYEDLELPLRDLPRKMAASLLDAMVVNVRGGGSGSGGGCGLVAALREASTTAADVSVGGSYATVVGARPIDRLLRSLRLPPAVAAALLWRDRVREHKRRMSTGGGSSCGDDGEGDVGAVKPNATATECRTDTLAERPCGGNSGGGAAAATCASGGEAVVVCMSYASGKPDPAEAPPPSLPPQSTPPRDREAAAILHDATFAWTLAARPCLYNISLIVPRGGLTVVVGRVGAGKSSLLASLLGPGGIRGGGGGGGGGELPLLRGICRVHALRLSYAPQQPWVFAGTVRENVLLGSAVDKRLYWQVLHDCALLPDLAAMPDGDLAQVGDNGCKLSGGQRARLGLARALYHAASKPASVTCSGHVHVNTAAAVTFSAAGGAAQPPRAHHRRAVQHVPRQDKDLLQDEDPIQDLECGGQRQDLDPRNLPGPRTHNANQRGPDSNPALHSDPDVMVLLDDVLASLDRSCAAHVVQHALLGRLLRPGGPQLLTAPKGGIRQGIGAAVATALQPTGGTAASATKSNAPSMGPSVVLVSNDVRCLRAASLVVAMEGGRVTYLGSPEGYFVSEHCLHHHHQKYRHQDDQKNHMAHQRHQPYNESDCDASAMALTNDQGGVSAGTGDEEGGVGRVRGCCFSPTSPHSAEHREEDEDENVLTNSGGGGGCSADFTSSCSHSGTVAQAGGESGVEREEGPGVGAGAGAASSDWCMGSEGVVMGSPEDGSVTGDRAGETVQEEEREVGHVRWRVYGRYARAVGGGVVVAVLLSLALMQASRNVSDLWVAFFARSTAAGASAAGGSALTANAASARGAGAASIGCDHMGEWRRNATYSLPRPVLRPSNFQGKAHDCCMRRGPTASANINSSSGSSSSSCSSSGATPGEGESGWTVRPPLLPASSSLPGAWHWCSSASAAYYHPAVGVVAAPISLGGSVNGAGGAAAAAFGWFGAAATMCPHLAAAGAVAFPTQTPATDDEPFVGDSSNADGRSSRSTSSRTVNGNSGFWTARTFLWGVLAIAAANSVFTMARAFSFAFAGMRAAAQLHDKLLQAVLAAPMAFFDSVPHGRILNRFSSDMSTVDDSLPFILNIALANAASLAGLLAVLCYCAPPLLPLLLPLAFIYRRLQLFYRSSSREVRRLEALARSPVYSAFGAVAEAAPLMRAFGVQPYFLDTAVASVTCYQRAAITGGAASAWLGLRLQLLASGLVVTVAALSAWRSVGGSSRQRHDGSGGIPYSDSDGDGQGGGGGGQGTDQGDLIASLAGLSLAYALPIVGLLNGLLTSTAETEQEMIAVERLTQYVDELVPQPMKLPPLLPPSQEEADGCSEDTGAAVALRMLALVVRYRRDLRPALNGLSLAVHAGQHVGLCGRTGAGKSSVVAALLRLVEAESGCVFLYGKDVRSLTLAQLRSSVGVLLQRPFFVSGTVRENLDPLAAVEAVTVHRSAGGSGSGGGVAGNGAAAVGTTALSDEDLVTALRRVELWDALAAAAVHNRHRKSANGTRIGLQQLPPPATVAEVLNLPLGALLGAVGLSAGQQQLLCLARLLLRPRRLVLLDECSAYVDPLTSATIRRLVSEQILQRNPGPVLGSASTTESLAHTKSMEMDVSRQQASLQSRFAAKDPTEAVSTAAHTSVSTDVAWPIAVLEVAHDLAAIDNCDRVVVLEAGRAVEEGPPQELAVREGGSFRALRLAATGAMATAEAETG